MALFGFLIVDRFFCSAISRHCSAKSLYLFFKAGLAARAASRSHSGGVLLITLIARDHHDRNVQVASLFREAPEQRRQPVLLPSAGETLPHRAPAVPKTPYERGLPLRRKSSLNSAYGKEAITITDPCFATRERADRQVGDGRAHQKDRECTPELSRRYFRRKETGF